MKATNTPIREIGSREFMCGRCGIIRAYGGGTRNPEYCGDCKPEAINLGWAPQPVKLTGHGQRGYHRGCRCTTCTTTNDRTNERRRMNTRKRKTEQRLAA